MVGKRFLTLLMLLCATGCGASFRTRPTVVFIGDSITYDWSQSWAGQQTTFAQEQLARRGRCGADLEPDRRRI